MSGTISGKTTSVSFLLECAKNIQHLQMFNLHVSGDEFFISDSIPHLHARLTSFFMDTRQTENSILAHSLRHISTHAALQNHQFRSVTLMVTDFPRPGALEGYISVSLFSAFLP